MKRSLRNYDKALLNNSNTENFNNAPTTLDLHPVNKRRSSAVDKPEAKILKQEDSKKILTFGFIGLSNIVARYVNNLIKSGHKIIIWSISSLKCTPINGAILASNGEDLVKMSDIIFSCFGNERRGYDDLYHMNELISMITNGKGYVEMSGIDIQLSETFNKDIASNGGRYLEVMLQGTDTELNEGNLVCMAAGDKTLYVECQSLFNSIAQKSFYFDKIGDAIKMNGIVSSIKAVIVAGVAEGIALGERASLPMDKFLEILAISPSSSPFVMSLANAMIHGNSLRENEKLDYVQRDLFMTLKLSQTLVHSVPTLAAVNEVLKDVKHLGYNGNDISTVYHYYTRKQSNSSSNDEENSTSSFF